MSKIETTTTIDITPELMAKIFWEMDDEDQIIFFEEIWQLFDGTLGTQMDYVAKNIGIGGKLAMETIGNAAKDAP